MKRQIFALSLGLLAVAAGVQAKEGVANAAAGKRMDLMDEIRASFAVIGGMAQGKTAFDADAAAAARAKLLEDAAMIPAVFKPEESDPKSKAAPAIWEDWDEFTEHAGALETAVQGLDTASLDTVKAGFGPVAKSCGSCHGEFRLK
ncbi:cytochrome c [Pseudooceanicola sp. CBS1P-1]|uniref:Cytochrome c n=1 Tax=Pseudooceanicola albus TaxID=2692189 RepID=A0A6L7GAK6_9RHOB|nr:MULTISPECIES: cytochrome c [Pseudooceanicola]MBT9384097.1 cytochrome c [Pseudooceanicola endophyticus]MXN19803.1 cytochrome c [Pseudooceanicola albus]